MNGFGLLLLLAATGQLPAAGPTDQTDWGWQIAKNGELEYLEYIVQIHPDKVNILLQKGFEQASSIPPELAGRVSRVVVRVGTEVLPRTPSIQEIQQRIPSSSPSASAIVMPQGMSSDRFSNIDPTNAPVVLPVTNSGSGPQTLSNMSVPNLPSLQGSNEPVGPATSLSDAGSEFLAGARDPSSIQAGQLDSALAQNTLNRNLRDDPLSLPGASKYNNTATAPAPGISAAPAPITSSLPSNAGAAPLGGPISTVGNPGIAGTLQGNSGNSYSAPLSGSSASYPNSQYPNSQYSSSPNQTGTTGNYGSTSGFPSSGGAASSYDAYGTRTTNSGLGSFAGKTFTNNGGTQPNYPPSASTNPYGQPSYSTHPSTAMNPGVQNNNWSTGVSPYQYTGLQGSGSGPYSPTGSQYAGTSMSGSGYYSNDPASLYNQPSSRIASNSMPGTSGMANNGTGAMSPGVNPVSGNPQNPNYNQAQHSPSYNDGTARPGDPNYNAALGSYGPARTDAILPILFVLSLVVNFYLGMLIRKLLTRYRSLLSSVRSQAV
ncbi:MAG: hypothetical protein U0892_17485 [Pirellulales bacterium]